MTWLAPWALVGLAAVALPVLVHWLARHEADRRPFPTVRFVPQTPPTSVRRHRLTDLPLLAVRAAIVAAAAAALAAPALVRPPSADARPPRAVVVDTSASVSTRTAADGRTGTTLADAVVTALEPAPRAVVIPADDLREGLAQAAAWLRAQPGAGEATVVSDFQVGAITEADLDVLPASAGRRLIPLPVAGAVPAPARGSVVRVYGAPAAATAARQVTGIELGGEFPGGNSPPSSIVLVFPGAPEAAAQQAQARPLDSPALYMLAREVDPALTAGRFLAGPDASLLVMAEVPPDSVDAAALIARALEASTRSAVSLAEQEPDTVPAAEVETWQRAPRPDLAPTAGTPQPFGRWLWALVLVLLALEWWMRRSRPSTQVREEEDAHARVA